MLFNGPPKGILKNKSTGGGGSSSGERNGSEGGRDGNLSYGGFGSSSSTSSLGWGSVFTSPPQRSESGDLTNSLLHLESGSGRIMRSKLHEFVSRKGEMLFRPLGSDEIPIMERGAQSNTKDHFGVAPSLDFFLTVDLSERRTHFFNTAQPGEICVAELTSKTAAGLFFNLLCMEGARRLFLEELDIKAYCPVSQMIPAIHPGNPNKIFAPGDLVRCEILSVKPESGKVVLGMKGNALSVEMKHSAQLGLTFQSELPPAYTVALRERKLKSERTYEDLLDESLGFHNPNGVACLASSMGILNNRNTMMTGLRGVFPENEFGSNLRRLQNGKWAHGSVAEGIRHFKNGDLTEAFQCLNKALSIDVENVEGLVARGALYANKGGYEKAIEDFESALKVNPNHFNAKKYLAETLVALGKQQEESGKIDEAVGSYGKCLSLRGDHPEAKDAVWSIYTRYEKLDFSKLNPLQRGRVIELKEKMKNLLINELKSPASKESQKKEAEGGKERRKKKDSSSDSSSSDSSDSDEKKGKKKKKKRKKRKKKSKKEEAKPIPQPLSPFSKRMAEGGGDMVPFNSASNWAPKSAPVPPVVEEKKKKREKRRKKRGSSDSSSSSSSSSSESEKEKKSKSKRKKKPSLANLGDGDLEAKLSAYFSKVEQEKIKESVPLALPPSVQTVTLQPDVKFTLEPHSEKFERKEPIITRVLPKDDRHEVTSTSEGLKRSGVSTSGRIELRTDEYGNYLHPPSGSFLRTVVNTNEEGKPKFEMKIRGHSALVPPAEGMGDEVGSSKSDSGSKWRKIGDPTPNPTYTVTPLDGTSKGKPKKDTPFASSSQPTSKDTGNTVPPSSSSTILPPQGGTLYVPPPTRPARTKEELERNYRRKSFKSPSRSRTRSRSPLRSRSGRGRRSKSRSRSRRSRSRSDSRGRGRSRSPRRGVRAFRGSRGRFSRGGGAERIERVRRTFLGDPPTVNRHRFRFPESRMRNIFANSRSRSRSTSRSRKRRSRSTSRPRASQKSRRRSRSGSKSKKSGSTKSPQKDKQKEEGKVAEKGEEKKEEANVTAAATATAEISIGSLTTTEASEVEKLLDQRKAEKKEEMKERNPDFFRPV